METKDNYLIIFYGIAVSNLFAFILMFLTTSIIESIDNIGGILVFSEFVLIPIGMGVICFHFWKTVTVKLSRYWKWLLLNTIVALLFSWTTMGEGYICLIIVSPLILVFMFVGILISKYLYNQDNNSLNASTAAILIAIFIFDTFSEHNFESAVTDKMIIKAPKEVVWKYVGAHPVNSSPNNYWLFNVGLPYPIQSTVSADSLGANRKCIFSNGAVFDETVTEYIKDSVFTFDIIEQPADPEIIGHIEIKRGKFILEENPDGTTTLTGISWFGLKVYPAWYYNLWAEDITRNVHLRVMDHIKLLAEKDVQL